MLPGHMSHYQVLSKLIGLPAQSQVNTNPPQILLLYCFLNPSNTTASAEGAESSQDRPLHGEITAINYSVVGKTVRPLVTRHVIATLEQFPINGSTTCHPRSNE